MFDFIRAVCAVPEIIPGDTTANTERIVALAEKNADADIIVFPELCISGYTCGDLFLQEALLTGVTNSVKAIAERTSDIRSLIAVGAPLRLGGQLYDCAVVICRGIILGINVKTFLPNYEEFYEKRWFSSSLSLDVFSVSSKLFGIGGDYDIPVGSGLVYNLGSKCRVCAEICEDLWSPLPPSTYPALAGADVIINLSASNEIIGKRQYRREIVAQQSARTVSAYIYASAGSSESTTDLIFSGHSMICENGKMIAENKELIETGYSLRADIDMGRITADRIKHKNFADCASANNGDRMIREICVEGEFGSDGSLYDVGRLPFVPSSESDRIERCMDIFRMQSAALAKRAATVGGHMVLGVSGGLDSTLALLVSVQAARLLSRPATDVIALTLPCFGTTERTHTNADALMRSLGVEAHEIDIKDACTRHCEDIGHPADKFDVTYENIQARERTQVLMDYASERGGFVVGTGDLSELALGWCTYNADHMSMYGVNAGVPKTLIRWMISALIDYDVFPGSTDILKDIIDTPISPELLPPDEKGDIAQQTEEIIGPYALHDFFLYYMIRFGFSPEKIFFLAKKAFKDDYAPVELLKWMKVFYKRFFTQQFKRSCLPDGVKIGSVCLSPRGDWRMPSDASCRIWLDELERIKI
ncbi:MAG: NAD(+) synthase [Clostridia bacterium]|nr:NAD(+) synthase [Clostridia bacterium]